MNDDLILPYNYNLFQAPVDYRISNRKLEQYRYLAEVKQYYARNPVRLIEDVFGAKLQDSQAYIVERSWNTPYVLWNCSRGTGKTTIVDLMCMAKMFLYNNYSIAVAAGSGDQSIITFNTLEKLALQSIESMPGLTDVFKEQVSITNSNTNGFIHAPSGHKVELYNNANLMSMNSSINKKRGQRRNLVVFDETGWLSDEMLSVYSAFTIVEKSAKLGGQFSADTIKLYPKDIPNQLWYVSSASDTSTPFYQRYRDFSKQMLLGNKDYFVAELNCDVVINSTVGGKKFPVSFLKKETVESEMRSNSIKAEREYYCRFSDGEALNSIIKRAWIARNSYTRKPVLFNDANDKKFCFFYDSARSSDNSILLICEEKEDEKKGIMLDIANVVSFADLGLRRKTPMRYQEQISAIRELLLLYNGDAPDYDNITAFYADAGSGGGGNSWVCDSLMESWVDSKGVEHKGLIDPDYSSEYVKRFPNTVKKLKMINPGGYKSEAFESLIRMIEEDLITFPADYEGRGYLNIYQMNEKTLRQETEKIKTKLKKKKLTEEEFDRKLKEEIDKLDVGEVKMVNLNVEEEIALKQIDAMKEEITSICRTKRESGKDSFNLPTHKDASLSSGMGAIHDDRAYTLALSGLYLATKRASKVRNRKKKEDISISSVFKMRAPSFEGMTR